jgi:hypothetical protein
MMEGELIFCTDSILRFRSHYDETTALPLLALQNTASDADPFFLLRFFRHPVGCTATCCPAASASAAARSTTAAA